MEIILTIPDEVAAEIQNGSNIPLSRRLLELAAIQAHQADLITEREVMAMLGFESREELYEFFKDVNFANFDQVAQRCGVRDDDLHG